ncbi:hypothetical protein LCGC14_2352030, partial [marine sediment metagenome]
LPLQRVLHLEPTMLLLASLAQVLVQAVALRRLTFKED